MLWSLVALLFQLPATRPVMLSFEAAAEGRVPLLAATAPSSAETVERVAVLVGLPPCAVATVVQATLQVARLPSRLVMDQVINHQGILLSRLELPDLQEPAVLSRSRQAQGV